MYKQKRHSRYARNKSYGHGPRRSGNRSGGYKNKSFDPRAVISKSQNTTSASEPAYEIQHEFRDFNLNTNLYENIISHGFKAPTPIQDQAIPIIISGRDVVGVANTGTGKTAAFLIPLINKVFNNRKSRTLILTPTRELASQISAEFKIFSAGLKMQSTTCIGGVSIRQQIYNLDRNPHFVIGTPGRILDLIERQRLDLSRFDTIVLDEVDRMLDMGFVHDINKIVSNLPQERQSLFFSATLDNNVTDVMQKFVKNPAMISVKTKETRDNIRQDVIEVKDKHKPLVLMELLNGDGVDKTLIFMRTKRSANTLHKDLSDKGFRTGVMHGNKSQSQRQRALDEFKKGRIRVLIATDVAARGLDVNDITHVINYDLPESYEMYIHRIGRTGRANKKGIAITLVG